MAHRYGRECLGLAEYKIGLGLIVAAIGFAMCALAIAPGHTHRTQAFAGPAFHFQNLQPVY
jgi:hypothetical protein